MRGEQRGEKERKKKKDFHVTGVMMLKNTAFKITGIQFFSIVKTQFMKQFTIFSQL